MEPQSKSDSGLNSVESLLRALQQAQLEAECERARVDNQAALIRPTTLEEMLQECHEQVDCSYRPIVVFIYSIWRCSFDEVDLARRDLITISNDFGYSITRVKNVIHCSHRFQNPISVIPCRYLNQGMSSLNVTRSLKMTYIHLTH